MHLILFNGKLDSMFEAKATNQRNQNDRCDADGRDDGGLVEVDNGAPLADLIVVVVNRLNRKNITRS